MFGGLILLQEPSNFGVVTATTALFSRVGTWLFGIASRRGKLLLGIVPLQGVSWEGHLFGFLGGIFAARHLTELKEVFDRLVSLINQTV